MSDKAPLCTGRTYRGILILTIRTDDESRCVVVGTANRQAVQLHECTSFNEATALVDAALLLTVGTVVPVQESGGARADGFGAGSIYTA